MRPLIAFCFIAIMIFLTLLLLSTAAFASDTAIDLAPILTAVFGDSAASVLVAVSVVGYIWAQLRQFISAESLAKLPRWAIWLLELLAANRGQSRNGYNNNPSNVKKWGG